MNVGTGIKEGKDTGRNLIKAAEKAIGESKTANFAMVFSTKPVKQENIEELKDILSCPFIGGYTEGIIYGGKLFENCAGVLTIQGIKAITEISDMPDAIGHTLSKFDRGSVFLFMSWMTEKISLKLKKLYNFLSYKFSYVGGCTGCHREGMSMHFNEREVSKSKICAAAINLRVNVAFDHGWEVMSGPYIITNYSGRRIYELDGKKALDVYLKATGCGNDFELCRKRHPLGFLCRCGKYILRAPIDFEDDGSIVVMSEVPHSSVTVIMDYEEEDVISAAESAARKAVSTNRAEFAVIFDCISRKYVLGKKFREETKRFEEVLDIPYIGMLSVGEFVSTDKVYVPAFHNKTVVVAAGGK